MGHMLIEALRDTPDCQLAGALDIPSSLGIGNDATGFLGQASGVTIESDIRKGLANSHVLIDFTRPEGTMAHVDVCRAMGVKMVIGTTGFSDAQKAHIAEAAKHTAIVMAPNMSVGVNVTLKLLQMAAKAMPTGYDIEIIEAHHRHKVDAPSGTALKMGEVMAEAMGRNLNECAVMSAMAIQASAIPTRLVLPLSVAAILWATTLFYLPVLASVSKSHTALQAALLMPKAACAPPLFWPTKRQGCLTCLMCLGCDEPVCTRYRQRCV